MTPWVEEAAIDMNRFSVAKSDHSEFSNLTDDEIITYNYTYLIQEKLTQFLSVIAMKLKNPAEVNFQI